MFVTYGTWELIATYRYGSFLICLYRRLPEEHFFKQRAAPPRCTQWRPPPTRKCLRLLKMECQSKMQCQSISCQQEGIFVRRRVRCHEFVQGIFYMPQVIDRAIKQCALKCFALNYWNCIVSCLFSLDTISLPQEFTCYIQNKDMLQLWYFSKIYNQHENSIFKNLKTYSMLCFLFT
jgi:hypothetical protein